MKCFIAVVALFLVFGMTLSEPQNRDFYAGTSSSSNVAQIGPTFGGYGYPGYGVYGGGFGGMGYGGYGGYGGFGGMGYGGFGGYPHYGGFGGYPGYGGFPGWVVYVDQYPYYAPNSGCHTTNQVHNAPYGVVYTRSVECRNALYR